MRRPEATRVASGLLILLAISLGAARNRTETGAIKARAMDASRPECPEFGEWTYWFDSLKHPTIVHTGQLALAGPITNVPEFHDCQRFIKENGGTLGYLSLNAVFARYRLAEVTAPLDRVPYGDSGRTKGEKPRQPARGIARPPSSTVGAPPAAGAPRGIPSASDFGKPIAVGEVMVLDSDDPYLGIKVGFNCLYLYGKPGAVSGLEARMVFVGSDDKDCKAPLPPAAGTKLEVQRSPYPKGAVPPVARWEWDRTHKRQIIGIECGIAWCHIGPVGFTAPLAYGSTTGSPGQNIFAVQGWYDEQRLAIPNSTTPPNPGTVIGTLVPAPDLETYQGTPESSAFTGKWVRVATASLATVSATYQNKLNLDQATPTSDRTNVVSLCFGDKQTCVGKDSISSASCKDPGPHLAGRVGGIMPSVSPQSSDPTKVHWWAKIESRQGKGTKYYCVVRRQHDNIHIPGVVRWRWAINDETMWIRCLEGCCEVEAGHS